MFFKYIFYEIKLIPLCVTEDWPLGKYRFYSHGQILNSIEKSMMMGNFRLVNYIVKKQQVTDVNYYEDMLHPPRKNNKLSSYGLVFAFNFCMKNCEKWDIVKMAAYMNFTDYLQQLDSKTIIAALRGASEAANLPLINFFLKELDHEDGGNILMGIAVAGFNEKNKKIFRYYLNKYRKNMLDYDTTVVMTALDHGNYDIVDFMENNGCIRDYSSAMRCAAVNNNFYYVRRFVEKAKKEREFQYELDASAQYLYDIGNLEAAQYLVNRGAKVKKHRYY